MRKLLYIQVMHDQKDIGSFKKELLIEGEKRYGMKWKNHIKQVQESWNRIEENINKYLKIFTDNIRIYQDGLPVACEFGLKIVRKVARQGSKNFQILESLIEHGACLEEAENPDLLVQEHKYLSSILKATSPSEKLKNYVLYKTMSKKLLDERDKYIAERINTTLKEDEVGIAFFGGSHSITDKLNKDIEVLEIREFNDKISIDLCCRNHLV